MDLSNSAINKIGDVIRDGKNTIEYNKAVANLNEWREAHGPLMNKYYSQCVRMAKNIDGKNIIVAQRLKRLPTIIGKLNRFKSMRLSSMQDIAGIRIIVDDMHQFRLVESRIKHWKGLVKISNYIDFPKDSGYRGKHFIINKNGMLVEIQLRTQLQHLWATSVETIDIARGTSIKINTDKTYWRDFFCQTSSVFALAEETNPVSTYHGQSLEELCATLDETISKNGIYKKLETIALTNLIIQEHKIKKAYYLVINLDFKNKICQVIRYKEQEYNMAVEYYQNLENSSKIHNSVVLVSVNDLKKLRDAYPNYFIDLNTFSEIVKFMLDEYKIEG